MRWMSETENSYKDNKSLIRHSLRRATFPQGKAKVRAAPPRERAGDQWSPLQWIKVHVAPRGNPLYFSKNQNPSVALAVRRIFTLENPIINRKTMNRKRNNQIPPYPNYRKLLCFFLLEERREIKFSCFFFFKRRRENL